MALEALAPRPGERRRGIEPAGEEDDRFPAQRLSLCLALAAAWLAG